VTEVVIVSRTRMHSGVCIGGLTRDEHRNVRLLPQTGAHSHPVDAPYRIGQIWEMNLEQPAVVQPPHVEDMLVRAARYSALQDGLDRWLRASVLPWEGDASGLFDGRLHRSTSGSAYISHEAVPESSVGFWMPTQDLRLDASAGARYVARWGSEAVSVAYVGLEEPLSLIPSGTLVRVSLARWFAPGNTGFEACWLQISGWYGQDRPGDAMTADSTRSHVPVIPAPPEIVEATGAAGATA
jgi:hypothetical protein